MEVIIKSTKKLQKKTGIFKKFYEKCFFQKSIENIRKNNNNNNSNYCYSKPIGIKNRKKCTKKYKFQLKLRRRNKSVLKPYKIVIKAQEWIRSLEQQGKVSCKQLENNSNSNSN